MKLTREDAVRLHRELWNNVVDILKKKLKVEREKYFSTYSWDGVGIGNIKELAIERIKEAKDKSVRSHCFCCELTKRSCSKCPIQWCEKEQEYTSDMFCMCIESPYMKMYELACNPLLTREQMQVYINLAKQVAELPEKEI